MGCKGGDFNGGFEYIIKNGGLDTEQDYPYLAKDSDCDGMKVLNRKVSLHSSAHGCARPPAHQSDA